MKFNRDINLQDDIANLNSNKTTIFNIQTYLVH